MTTRQLNKLNMILGLRRFIADPKMTEAREKIEGFEDAWNDFLPLVAEIRKQAVTSRGLVTGGTTETKVSIREQLAAEGVKIGNGLGILAEVTGDAVLADKARVTKTTFLSGREVEAAERADALLLVAVEHVDKLGKYAVSQERLDRFEGLCQKFSDLIGRPRSIILERKTTNRSLAELFDEADVQLSRMDRLCPSLEETHPEFVAGYREHRAIVNVSASRALTDEELITAIRELEERDEAEARKQAARASQEAEEAQRVAQREALEERLRAARKGIPAAGLPSAPVPVSDPAPAPAPGTPNLPEGDRPATAPKPVNGHLPS